MKITVGLRRKRKLFACGVAHGLQLKCANGFSSTAPKILN